MHSSPLPAAPNQSVQPPLPPAAAVAALPPLPPGPSPSSEAQVTVTQPNCEPSQGNNSKKRPAPQTAFLPSYPILPSNSARQCLERNQDRCGADLPYSSPFSFQDDQLPHLYAPHSSTEYPYNPPPQASDAYLQGFSYFPFSGTHPPMSVPPPLFSVPPANFSFPPPLLKQPASSFESHLKIGIPFPPPGYDSNLHPAQRDDVPDMKTSRDIKTVSQSRRSRSKSPNHFPTKSRSRDCRSLNHKRRSRSRSCSRRRSHSRSHTDTHYKSRDDRNRRSRSKGLSKCSKTPRQTTGRSRSRSPSRSSLRSRSKSRSRRSSRSPSRSQRHTSSSSRALRRSRSRSPSRSRHWSRPESRLLSQRSQSSHRNSKNVSKTEINHKDLLKRIGTPLHNVKKEDADRSSANSAKDEDDDSRRNEDKNSDRSTGSLPSKKSVDCSPENKVIESCKGVENLHSRKNGESSISSHRERSKSERESLVERWRLNNCKNLEEMANKLDVLSKMEADEIIELEKQTWTRSAPADLYYKRHKYHPNLMEATPKLLELCEKFESELVQRAECERKKFPAHQQPPRKAKFRVCRHTKEGTSSSSSSCEDSSSDEEDKAMMELERKRKHPQRLHPELWHNEPGEMNDGPLCRCSHRSSRSGIRHNVYVGEQKLEKCNVNTNNAGKLYHYRITMSPPVNFLTKTPTIVEHDSHEYIFEGFSMLSHFPLVKLPTCKVIRFNIEYTILYVDEAMPENFTIRELDLFYDYLFHEILELLDLDLRAFGDPGGCNQFHFMPRFVRDLPENGKEILSMNEVLRYLLKSNKPLVPEERLNEIYNMSLYDWQTFADEVKCMVVTKPGMKPCSLRVDQLDRETMDEGRFPEIVHFGIRPPQLSYAGNTEYQKHWREYVKFRHLLANMPKPSPEDKRKLMGKENRLQEMRTVSKMKRDVTIALSSQGFYRTGLMCDIIQHALLLPVLVCHLRFHKSLDQLEEDMDYKFKNRYVLQLALTHPSYRENFGTNPDHARNSLTNCGIRQPEYGDRRIHYMNTRKRGINTLIQIMSRFGKKEATESNIGHNERLEFLGDAVVEFITSIHLFHLFPDLEEGGLATYRAAIVQNQHLAVMAKRLNLDSYMLYAHGSDLCHDLELRHAMANCFEALMGALFLDGGIEVADKVFGFTLWKEEVNLSDVWMNYPLHPLQEQEPAGDRQWIKHFPVLQKLTEFEKRSGVFFKHIRLLARAFTDRSVGYTNLTLGSNQRLEFLGDTVLQIIASEYLYKFFPEHHEGHLSLLRSSLVNNRTQAVVCDDLGMTDFALYANPKHDIKTKDRADLLEAYLGALYIDKGLKHCHLFCEVCFFPRLQDFIMNQDWNDPKSKLQQCCLTLRTMEGGEPDIPVYKVIQCMGPTNTRIYTVAVYFRGERLAQASGHSIQQAEMNAANEALELSTELFPQLDHQRRVIAKSMKKQKKRARREAALKAARDLEMRELEAKYRDRDRNRDQVRERDRERNRYREKGRETDRHKGRERNRDRENDQDKGRERNKDKDRLRDRDRDKERNREKDRDRKCEKERERNLDKGKERDRERERNCRSHNPRDCRSSHRTEDKSKDCKNVSNWNTDSTKRGSRERECQNKGGRMAEIRVNARKDELLFQKDGSKQTESDHRGNGDRKGSGKLNLEFSGREDSHAESADEEQTSSNLNVSSSSRRDKNFNSGGEDEDYQNSKAFDEVDFKWCGSPEAQNHRSPSCCSGRSTASSTRSSPVAYSAYQHHLFSGTDGRNSSSSSHSSSSDHTDGLVVDIRDQEYCCETVSLQNYSFMEGTLQIVQNGEDESMQSDASDNVKLENAEQTTQDEEINDK